MYGVTLALVPTKRRRHALTETPPVQSALDELRRESGDDCVDLPDLVIRGARQKTAELRAADEHAHARRRRFADWVRSGDLGIDHAAADQVEHLTHRKLDEPPPP